MKLHLPDHPAFEPMGRQILRSLGTLGRRYGMERPENKYWNRYADALIEKGFVEDVCGFVAITDLGREQLRSPLTRLLATVSFGTLSISASC